MTEKAELLKKVNELIAEKKARFSNMDIDNRQDCCKIRGSMTTPNRHKNKQLSYYPPADVAALLEKLPKGERSQAINEAIRAVYGEGKQQAKAVIKALLIQLEEE